MTATAAKKAAANKPAKKAASSKAPAEAAGEPGSAQTSPPPSVTLEAPIVLSLAEEQRTANLIAVLALGPEAWSNLYGAGAPDDAADLVAEAVVSRLGLSS